MYVDSALEHLVEKFITSPGSTLTLLLALLGCGEIQRCLCLKPVPLHLPGQGLY